MNRSEGKSILSVSTENDVRAIRNRVLSKAGYEVVSASTVWEAVRAATRHHLHAAVLGDGLSVEDRAAVARFLIRHRVPVIVLDIGLDEGPIPADQHLHILDGPAALLGSVSRLVRRAA